MRNGWSSTWPRSRTDACRETGKSGLVTSFGFVNVGHREVDSLGLGSNRQVTDARLGIGAAAAWSSAATTTRV